MLNLESRKQNTKWLISNTKNILYKINPNDAINGLIVLCIHWILVGVPLVGLFIFNLNWKFYLSTFLWILILAFHFYFNGCICTRLERDLWNTKDWYGPWILPFNILQGLDVPITSALTNNIYICSGIAITIWIIVRIILNS